MSRVILFNKPFGVLTQFRDQCGRPTMSDFIPLPHFYAAGRLDRDSEGLVVLTDDGSLQARIANPRYKMAKYYLAQVEGEPDDQALNRLRSGVDLGDFSTSPCEVRRIAPPDYLWPREPPIRYRAKIPTSWLKLVLREGKNRQVRRMTATVGFPTLRLVRWAVGDWDLSGLAPGEWRMASQPSQPGAARRVNASDAPRTRGVQTSLPIRKRKETP